MLEPCLEWQREWTQRAFAVAKNFAVVPALVAILSGSALAQQRLAVADLDFLDTSYEPTPQKEEHLRRLSLFLDEFRGEIVASSSFDVVLPDCPTACSPGRTSFEDMAAATVRVGAELLLVGRIHKISTLIGTINLTMIDLERDRVICERSLNYRGDDDEAWSRAAKFAAKDVVRYCQP